MIDSSLKFVVSIEDQRPFTWQLAVFLESLQGKLPEGWETWVVVCNDHEEFSPALSHVLETYGARAFCAENYPRRVDFDFIAGRTPYSAINKITAFEAIGPHLASDDMICLLDTDIFLYGALNQEVFPSGNAVCEHPLIRKPLFSSDGEAQTGVDLGKFREAMGASGEFHKGGVVIFLNGEAVKNRDMVCDCYRFTQALFLLGKTLRASNHWIAEMPAYALSLSSNRIPYELLQRPEFSIEIVRDKEVPEGTFYHYFAPEAFYGSPWGKKEFRDRDLLRSDLERFKGLAQTAHEREFFEYAIRARDRLSIREGPLVGAAARPELNQGKKAWLRERVKDSLRFGFFYLQAGKDRLRYFRFRAGRGRKDA